jgi:hypothetical protein
VPSTQKEIKLRIPPLPVYRTIGEIDAPSVRPDRVKKVGGARIVFANHALLRRDFPGLGGKGRNAERLRERWLLDKAGIMSATQLAQTDVNTPIAAGGRVRKVWRPDTYGRAVIVPVKDPDGVPGLLDVKGAGVAPGKTPSVDHHSSGLCQLREAFRELLFQLAIDRAFGLSQTKFWTLPVYGVIDLGFDAKTRRGESVPACVLIRRAHRRPLRGIQYPWSGSREELLQFEIELFLRQYGLTSCQRSGRFRIERTGAGFVVTGAFKTTTMPATATAALETLFSRERLPNIYEAPNIQLTRQDPTPKVRAQLVDFGHFEMRPRFDYALMGNIHGGTVPWGAKIPVGDRAFAQPDAELCYSDDLWGIDPMRTKGGKIFDRTLTARPWIWTDRLAKNFRAGRIDRADVFPALRKFVEDSGASSQQSS